MGQLSDLSDKNVGPRSGQQDHESLVADLLNPAKGYVIIKGYFSEVEIDTYRNECQQFLNAGPVCFSRINTPSVPDYVHPRSHDKVGRTYRIYQYPHNKQSNSTAAFFRKALSLRNDLEQTWVHDPIYRVEKETLQDYVVVTKYISETGLLPRHRDYVGPAPFPLLQSLVLLSKRPDDYTGGDFYLYTKEGVSLSLADDIGATKGDLVVFDKSLEHSVELTRPGTETAISRWSVIVGARAKMDSRAKGLTKRWLYGRPFYPYTKPIAKALRLMGLSI